ncbi:MAG: hypothetical protein AAFV29_01810 [Myxococcota bacterium]
MAIPSGLRTLLSQMGLAQAAAGKAGGKESGTQASAMKGQKGSAEGQLLGEDGLLRAGLGYAGHDKHTARKNVAERTNLTRFLREQMKDGTAPEKGKLASEDAVLLAREAPESPLSDAEVAEARDGAEAHDAPQESEARTQDRREDGRVQGQKEANEPTEARETSESAEAEQQQSQHEDQDEEDKPGAGWVAEENEEEGEERKRGLRAEDSLGASSRCRGHLDDGSRCLRKPTDGTPYCREHAALWQPSKPSLRG